MKYLLLPGGDVWDGSVVLEANIGSAECATDANAEIVFTHLV
jgi:hypothetical protein